MSAGQSISSIPALFVTAVARDNAFGHEGIWSAALGRFVGTVNVRTSQTLGEYAIIDTHDLGQLVSLEEVLVRRIYDLSLVPFVPEIVVDCGSHIGLFSLIAGLRYLHAKLIAYEPQPENFRACQNQLSRFGQRVSLIKAAVSTENGEQRFALGQSNSGRLIREEDICCPARDSVLVQTIDLSTEAVSWNGKKLLIKIDIEGAEVNVVSRLIPHLPDCCALFLEAHGHDQIRESLHRQLLEARFTVSVTRINECSADWLAVRAA